MYIVYICEREIYIDAYNICLKKREKRICITNLFTAVCIVSCFCKRKVEQIKHIYKQKQRKMLYTVSQTLLRS